MGRKIVCYNRDKSTQAIGTELKVFDSKKQDEEGIKKELSVSEKTADFFKRVYCSIFKTLAVELKSQLSIKC